MSNKFKSMLAAGTILAGSVFAPSAEAAEQKDTRNGWERFVHGTTELVDKGTHYLTEVATYPVRLLATGVDGIGYGVEKGLDFVGDYVPGIGPVTDLTGDAVRTVTGLGATGLDIAANAVQGTVKYPIHLAGATLDASATATRDPSEAGRKLLKEGGILTAQYAGDMMLHGAAAVNAPINSAQNLLRSTVKSGGDLTAQTIGLFDQEAGANAQLNVEAINGANLVLNTGDAMLRGVVSAAPALAVKASPLLNDDIRGDTVDKIKTEINKATNGNPEALKEGFERNVNELKNDIQKTVNKLANSDPKKVVSTLRNTLAGLSMAVSDAERNEVAPQPPNMILETSGRNTVKEVVNSSEAYRAKMAKDAAGR